MIRFNVVKPSSVEQFDHNQLLNKGTVTHEDLDIMYNDYENAKDGNTSLEERLNNLTPVMNLSGLQDVDVTGINDGQTIIWNSTEMKFKPGTATGGSGGSGQQSGLSYVSAIEYNPDGTVKKETYSGDISKVIEYFYNQDGTVHQIKTTFSDSSIATSTFTYDANGNVTQIDDTGTDKILIGSGSGGGVDATQIQNMIDSTISILESFYNAKIDSLEKAGLKMQFKYDIALNLVKNYCSDYFIDVLQDDSNIEEYDGTSFNSSTETIS